jgi:histidyl-tRNA synthetase
MENKYSRNDLSVSELVRFRTLERVFLNRCSQFGYQEIKTATIEPLHLFTAPGVLSDAKLRRIYSFIDWDGWSGERVSLRPDSSTCVVRFYNQHLREESTRQKLCYVENHFEWADSGDAISERWQFGVENIGERTPEADIEVIYMAYDILQEIWPGDFYLALSYPTVIKETVQVLSDEAPEQLAAEIKDKPALAMERLSRISGGESLVNLLSIKGNSATCLKNARHTLSDEQFAPVRPAMDNFIAVCELLDGLGCHYTVDFSSLLDLEYYTGISFQILSTAARKSRRDVLCSGGRYDNLIGHMDAVAVPATGFAFYVRNILDHLPEVGEEARNILIYVEQLARYNVETGQALCNRLSNMGFSVQISFASPDESAYEGFGLVIQVDRDNFADGYKILYSQKIDKPLLTNLFGELNGR